MYLYQEHLAAPALPEKPFRDAEFVTLRDRLVLFPLKSPASIFERRKAIGQLWMSDAFDDSEYLRRIRHDKDLKKVVKWKNKEEIDWEKTDLRKVPGRAVEVGLHLLQSPERDGAVAFFQRLATDKNLYLLDLERFFGENASYHLNLPFWLKDKPRVGGVTPAQTALPAEPAQRVYENDSLIVGFRGDSQVGNTMRARIESLDAIVPTNGMKVFKFFPGSRGIKQE